MRVTGIRNRRALLEYNVSPYIVRVITHGAMHDLVRARAQGDARVYLGVGKGLKPRFSRDVPVARLECICTRTR